MEKHYFSRAIKIWSYGQRKPRSLWITILVQLKGEIEIRLVSIANP